MSGDLETLAGLTKLNLELESLKQHGHTQLAGPLPADWVTKLEPVKEMARKREKTIDTTDTINSEVKGCQLCPLSQTRTNTVFGVGAPNARLMFIGEAPGAHEDKQGEPFVGKAGGLLTKMIESGMGLKREEVYIANILKCRPPGNRNPEPKEVELCEQYLIRQIAIIKPEVICALGAVAAQTLLKTKSTISSLRGEFHLYHNIPLLPTFHPAYLLRNPSMKTGAWEDLKMIMKKLNIRIPEKQ